MWTRWQLHRRLEDLNKKRAKARRRQRGQEEQEDSERKREVVMSMVARGQVGRAAGRIKSNGVASMDRAAVKKGLRAKFPEYPERPLPDTATKGQPVDNLDGLRDSFLNLERGSAPAARRLHGARRGYRSTVSTPSTAPSHPGFTEPWAQ